MRKRYFPLLALMILSSLFLLMILFFYTGYWSDFRKQKLRFQNLQKTMSEIDDTHNEEDFTDFPIDSDVKLNEIQLISSHNSYHRQPDELRLFLIGLVERDEPDKMRYSHKTYWEQFNNGVRSLELDIRYKKDRFEIIHVPLVGNRGHSPDFAIALKEIKLWSTTHPGHIPIMILLELKSDMMELDPLLENHSKESLLEMDSLIEEIFGRDSLLTPDDVRGTKPTLNDAVKTTGWPLVSQSLGKTLFILHENEEYRTYYLEGAPSLERRIMFTCAPPEEPDASFMLHNSVDVDEISDLVRAGYIIRTRADSDLEIDQRRVDNALRSGAQIITTDFPPGEPHNASGFEMYLKENKTIIKNVLLIPD
jgi:Phosphoinositide phospholipase C, Ca2+-dependent